MVNYSFISLFSAIFSIISIIIVFLIFKKVYKVEHRRPWLYIGISGIFLGISQILSFTNGVFKTQIFDQNITELIIYILIFIGMGFLTFGLLLEFLILKYIKGKFVKFKFVPVQEGSFNGKLDLDISLKNSYLAYKRDRNYLIEQFSTATRIGFEGFLITIEPPIKIRTRLGIEKTPIAWIHTLTPEEENSNYIKEFTDNYSGVIDSFHLNDLITYIDNFLESSSTPFILIEIDEFLKNNSFKIIKEFLNYLKNKISNYNGILIVMINNDYIKKEELEELKNMLKEIE
jgi:hypothetical protein